MALTVLVWRRALAQGCGGKGAVVENRVVVSTNGEVGTRLAPRGDTTRWQRTLLAGRGPVLLRDPVPTASAQG